MFRSFITWLKSHLIICTPCLLKIFFWLKRTTYHWWYWFPFLCDFFTSCCRLQWHAFVTCDVSHWSLQVSTFHMTLAERLRRCPKFTYSFKGFMIWHSLGCIMQTPCLSNVFSCRTYVATYHWLYWFLFFCDFFLCMSWNTCRCMCCTWHVPLVITGVYSSCDTDWEALKASKFMWSVYNSCDTSWEASKASKNHVSVKSTHNLVYGARGIQDLNAGPGVGWLVQPSGRYVLFWATHFLS